MRKNTMIHLYQRKIYVILTIGFTKVQVEISSLVFGLTFVIFFCLIKNLADRVIIDNLYKRIIWEIEIKYPV